MALAIRRPWLTLRNVPPVIGAWFPDDSEMHSGGYRDYLDAIAEHSHYNLLTTTMRKCQRQMTDPEVHDWFNQGNPIRKTLKVRGHDVTFDAVGIAAVRIHENDKVEAIAAGGLKSFRTDDVSIELPQRADIALWRDTNRGWQGVLQEHDGPVLDLLLAITKNWTRLSVTVRMG